MKLILLEAKLIDHWIGFGKIGTGFMNVYKIGFWIVWRGSSW